MPSKEKMDVAETRAEMKSIAQNGVGKPGDIYKKCQQSLSNEWRILLPSTEFDTQ